MKSIISIIALLHTIAAMSPPIAPKFPEELTVHGETRIDDYYWLKHRGDDLVLKYLTDENLYLDKAMAHTKLLRETLYQEMTNRLADSEISVPYLNNGYLYRKVYSADADYPLYQRKTADSDFAEWETILDVNDLANEAEYVEVDWLIPSPNNHLMSFSMDTTGNYEYDIRFINLITGKVLSDRIHKTWGGCVWSHDSKVVYFNVKDQITNRVAEVKSHRLGFENSTDKTIYFEKDSTFSAYIDQSMTDRYLYIACESTTSSEYRILDLSNRKSKLKVFSPREKDHLYYPYHHKNVFYILSNKNAINYKVMKTHIDSTEQTNWIEVIPHNREVNPVQIMPFRDFLVFKERRNGLPSFSIYYIQEDSLFTLKFDEVSYHLGISENHNFDADFFRFEYSSLKTPDQVIDYYPESQKKKVKFQKKIMGHYNPDNYTLERKYVEAQDGKDIPMTIIYNKHFINGDGENPSLIYGYGSYGSVSDAYFINSIISLLDRGVVYAMAHVRGGGGLGKYWYNDGKMLRKMNTFTDFIACADYLVEHHYSKHEIMFAEGMSAGGLLMGAIANMAPEKFRGIIAEVPFVDVITTMLDPDIPLTTLEYEEWGDPLVEQYYQYMKSYSPYDNVIAQNYPAMFITASYNDSQVQYWEPAKWTAKLRELKTDDNLLILSTDLAGSHEGASGRFSPYELIAMQQAFILDQAGYPYKGRPQ